MANIEQQAPQTREELLQQLRHRHITASEQNIIDFIRGLDDELQRINEEAR